MKPGDLVRRKMYPDEVGLFMGMITYKCQLSEAYPDRYSRADYTCAEVMWFHTHAPNGDAVSTVQHDLIEVVNESR